MRICIDLTSLADNFSGIERFALSIAKEMIKDKENQYVLIFKNDIHSAFAGNHENIEYVIIKGKNKLIFNQLLLPLKLLKIKADYYIFLAFPAPFFFFKKKTINTIHDLGCWDCPRSNKHYMIWYFKLLYWKASLNRKKIVTVSEFSKKRIVDILHVNSEDISVIYNGISEVFTDYRPNDEKIKEVKDKYDLPEKYFLCLSTLEPRKNLRLLIDAYVEVFAENKVLYELVLAGRKGWMIDELLANLDDEQKKHIHFTGFIDDNDLPVVYSRAECFIFPSLYEGFGIPPVEAMSVGTRVISSDSSSLPEILGNAAIYFKNQSKEDLKEKIIYVMEQNALEKRIQIDAGVKNSSRFRWPVSAQKFLKLIHI